MAQEKEKKCPHSHLPFSFLKRVGKVVETVGEESAKAAITVALSNLGAFSED